MRFFCRWHIAWSGVPSFRPIAVAIAVVIVGGSLLETGSVLHTSMDPSHTLLPIAAVAAPGDVLVAMAAPGRDAPAPQGRVVSALGSAKAVPAGVATDAVTVALSAWSLETLAAGLVEMRAVDSDPATTLAALASAGGALTPGTTDDPATPVPAGTRSSPQAARSATSTSQGKNRHARKRKPGPWRISRWVTWYGPGFYGNRTACGQRYTRRIVGVAHRSLPCGSLVQFRWHGRLATAPVIDRGPYGPPGYVFDWSASLACRVFRPKGMRNGCFTRADVRYRVVGKVNLHDWFRRRKRRG